MSHTLKTELIAFLARLDTTHLTAKKRKEVSSIVSHLSSDKIAISRSPDIDQQIDRFIELFFCAYPALMSPTNKIKLEHYLNNTHPSTSLAQGRPKK